MELHKDSVLIARNEGWLLIDADGTAGPLTPWQYGSPHCLCVDGEGTLWATLPKDGAWQLGRFSEGEGFKSHWQFSEPIDAIAWNKGNTALYALAPDSGTIYLLTRESPAIRRFASLPKGSGRLSGLALDFDCGVWTALKEGWSVVQFSADGNLERLMGVSMPSPTDLEFGGPDNNTLYLTSDRHSPSREALISAPLSGYLLEAHVDQAGIARSPSRFPAS